MNSFSEIAVTFAPAVVATVIAAATEATPIEYGVVGLVLVGGMFPVVRWMMRRLDWSQKETAAVSKRREDRQDRLVNTLGKMVIELRLLNQNFNSVEIKRSEEHRDVIEKLNSIQTVLFFSGGKDRTRIDDQ